MKDQTLKWLHRGVDPAKQLAGLPAASPTIRLRVIDPLRAAFAV